MSIGIGNLLNMFLHNGETNTVKAGVLHRSDPPQAILVESEADLEHLGEAPAGSIAYTAGYSSMWQLSAPGSWEAIEEEGGSGGGGLVVHMVGDNPVSLTLDKTWQEIYDALTAGSYVLALQQYESGVDQVPINNAEIDGADYCVSVGNQLYKANSADGYPTTGGGGGGN